MIIPARVPGVIEKLFPQRVWRIETDLDELFLTFDDGPHPDITPKVLDILKENNAKATFFCIGDRVKKFPAIYQRILDEGHATGNHTHHHLNGWKSNNTDYINDIIAAGGFIQSNLFRPPYGRITGQQFRKVSELGMKTVMWTVLSGDYDNRLSPQQVSVRVNTNFKKGSIYLFHDSEKAEKNMFFSLKEMIVKASQQSFTFSKISL